MSKRKRKHKSPRIAVVHGHLIVGRTVVSWSELCGRPEFMDAAEWVGDPPKPILTQTTWDGKMETNRVPRLWESRRFNIGNYLPWYSGWARVIALSAPRIVGIGGKGQRMFEVQFVGEGLLIYDPLDGRAEEYMQDWAFQGARCFFTGGCFF